MGSRRDIEFILKTELEAARARCRATLELKTTNGPREGITADEPNNAAVCACGEALQRFHDFILYGAIPDDLLPFVRAEPRELARNGNENARSGE
ncbi:MAG TPA: hypothetical protein VG345_15150 [Bryobacteraceae bacterium]|jgi:hypothetical protein|nr:hypothetical protein [Bryobacteraceae bacterium]